ncbi:unnamed protein product [Rotaria socialis]|uniref:Calponin-homology (CH) domain-containing protein n=1 Tax=Rotaria socialis TaxID=392032 RepID=A0A817RT52_9BILA|nr:unnamed protein product [Rotaria socialis]CAF3260929.1 unnamed protein product [Rotaria socialis]CAF3364865.1 unnamed protein product [Rotaria socialis]CAF3645882.1 unnamed protein product [Rotaria socialis]CAF3715962.1 unnamed protein product [Rotaria socialis]
MNTVMRAPKSGFAHDVWEKIQSKYNVTQAHEALEWISEMISEQFDTSGDMDNVYSQLKDGRKLCQLMNSIVPDSIRKINSGENSFKLMENIARFAEAAKTYGLSDTETFQTVDLYEKMNLHQVIVCLFALGRKAQKQGIRGLGPKESDKNERTFSAETLKQGNMVISTQYGYNKGATQSGIVFGNTRHM